MTDKRPERVDLTQFEGITLPDNWATLCPDKVRQYSVNVTALIADLEATREERDRLEAAMEYIAALAERTHLGRPRPSDKHCIYCMAYFALRPGAFGVEMSTDDYRTLIAELEADK